MAARHDISGHPLLTRDLGAALDAHTEVAERVLGITESYAGRREEDAVKSALALQVVHQVRCEEDNVWHLSSQSRGKRSHTARGGARAGSLPEAHPLAKRLVEGITSVGWVEMRSLR